MDTLEKQDTVLQKKHEKQKTHLNSDDPDMIVGLIRHWWGHFIHKLMRILVIFVLSLSVFESDSFIPEAG